MANTDWRKGFYDSFFSHHILITYLGDQIPKYHVLENPEGKGWVIGIFYPFIGGEYVPLEEDDEERLIFQTAEEAKEYADNKLK